MGLNLDELLTSFIVLWTVIDPIGTIPVFLAVTKSFNPSEKKKIALQSSLSAFGILLFFMIAGEVLLTRVGVSLAAFQTSGGVILFLFALNMIFGDSKPEEEMQLIKKKGSETAIFPLAIPSIASPGAILAIVLLAKGANNSAKELLWLCIVMTTILLLNYFLMRISSKIHHKIGDTGAIVISKVMGLILASIAANNVLLGIRDFFKITY